MKTVNILGTEYSYKRDDINNPVIPLVNKAFDKVKGIE